MLIKAGYDIRFTTTQPTPMVALLSGLYQGRSPLVLRPGSVA